MNTFVLVYRHDAFPAVEIRVAVKSELTDIQIERDAEPIFEIADDLLDACEQSLHDFTMVAVMHNDEAILEFNHNEPQLEWDAKQVAKKAEKERNGK
jgi:hypothetical protein